MFLAGFGSGFIVGILFTFMIGRAMRQRSQKYMKLNRKQRRAQPWSS